MRRMRSGADVPCRTRRPRVKRDRRGLQRIGSVLICFVGSEAPGKSYTLIVRLIGFPDLQATALEHLRNSALDGNTRSRSQSRATQFPSPSHCNGMAFGQEGRSGFPAFLPRCEKTVPVRCAGLKYVTGRPIPSLRLTPPRSCPRGVSGPNVFYKTN
jgi:hypothetical protein